MLMTPQTASNTEPLRSDTALRVEHLAHHYRPATRRWQRNGHAQSITALDDLSLTVQPGEIFAILGPNGGGKTTLFRILATLLQPDPDDRQPGTAEIFGHNLLTHPERVRQLLGVVFQHPSLDPKLTAYENLLHQGHLYGLSGTDLHQRIDHWLEQFQLAERRHDRVEQFSGGMRRRLELAKALLHEPRLLLMDEPATGLDPAARRRLWEHLHELRSRGLTIALTTHLMDEAERADRLAILAQGRLIALDTPARLKAQLGGDVIWLQPEPTQPDDVQQLLQAIRDRFGPFTDDEAAPRLVHDQIRFEQPDGSQRIARLADAFPGRFKRITVGQPTLEDVFVHLTGSTFDDHDQA